MLEVIKLDSLSREISTPGSTLRGTNTPYSRSTSLFSLVNRTVVIVIALEEEVPIVISKITGLRYIILLPRGPRAPFF